MKIRNGSNGVERVFLAIFFLAVLALLFSPLRSGAVDWSEYEYEPGEGIHEEEWYDPSDWFDAGGGVDYERDWYNYTYNYPYDYYGDGIYGYYDDGGYGFYDYENDYYTNDWYNREGEFEDWM
jgi:hypothetical protein